MDSLIMACALGYAYNVSISCMCPLYKEYVFCKFSLLFYFCCDMITCRIKCHITLLSPILINVCKMISNKHTRTHIFCPLNCYATKCSWSLDDKVNAWKIHFFVQKNREGGRRKIGIALSHRHPLSLFFLSLVMRWLDMCNGTPSW